VVGLTRIRHELKGIRRFPPTCPPQLGFRLISLGIL
jgi:hypothetical protein